MEKDSNWEVKELGVAVEEVKIKKKKRKLRRKYNGGFDLLLQDMLCFCLCFSFSLCFVALPSPLPGFYARLYERQRQSSVEPVCKY